MYLSTNFSDLKDYATFRDQSEMDDKIYEYISVLLTNEEPDSVIEVLRFFGRSSLRVTGVSFAKYDTIAQAIGYSKRTVIRAVKTLAEYGIIEAIPTTRKWLGRGRKKSVNVIRILANGLNVAPQAVTAGATDEPSDTNESSDKVSPEPINVNHTQELLCNTYTGEKPLGKPLSAYQRFKQLITDKKLRSRLYGIYLAQTKYLKDVYSDEQLAYEGVKAVMIAFKSKGIRNIAGYYNGVLSKRLDALYEREMESLYSVDA